MSFSGFSEFPKIFRIFWISQIFRIFRIFRILRILKKKLFHVLGKNVAEIALVLLFLPINIYYALQQFDKDSHCRVEISPIPEIIEETGYIHYQCQGKKMNFFAIAIWAHLVLLGLHGLCSVASIIWCLYFRSVTNLLNTIESMKKEVS